MRKRKKKILLIAILGIILLASVYIYRNIYVNSALIGQIDYMESKEDTPKLVKIFSNRWNPFWHRQTAFEQMAAAVMDPAAVEPLIRILQRRLESPHFREEAAFTLGCIGDERAIEPLIKALDYGPGIKQAALKGLTLIEVKDRKVVRVARKLLNDESEAIRDLAIIAIGVHGGEEEVDLLIEKLKNGNEGERWNATNALAKIGDKRAVEPLIERLESDPGFDTQLVGSACCIALGKIGDKRAVEPLIKALNDRHRVLDLEAAEALARIGDKRVVEPLKIKIKEAKQDNWERGFNELKKFYKILTGHEYQER